MDEIKLWTADELLERESTEVDFQLEHEYRRGYCDGFLAAIEALLSGGCPTTPYNRAWAFWSTSLSRWKWDDPSYCREPPILALDEIHLSRWQKIRYKILGRDNYRCAYCGAQAEHVDHIIPRCQGGSDDEDNLVAACARCNISKSGRTPRQAGMTFVDRGAINVKGKDDNGWKSDNRPPI